MEDLFEGFCGQYNHCKDCVLNSSFADCQTAFTVIGNFVTNDKHNEIKDELKAIKKLIEDKVGGK